MAFGLVNGSLWKFLSCIHSFAQKLFSEQKFLSSSEVSAQNYFSSTTEQLSEHRGRPLSTIGSGWDFASPQPWKSVINIFSIFHIFHGCGLANLNVTEVRYPAFPMPFPGIFNFTVGILDSGILVAGLKTLELWWKFKPIFLEKQLKVSVNSVVATFYLVCHWNRHHWRHLSNFCQWEPLKSAEKH